MWCQEQDWRTLDYDFISFFLTFNCEEYQAEASTGVRVKVMNFQKRNDDTFKMHKKPF